MHIGFSGFLDKKPNQNRSVWAKSFWNDGLIDFGIRDNFGFVFS
jgi:hypothetical protein